MQKRIGKLLIIMLLMMNFEAVVAQNSLTLEQCHNMALETNTQLKISQEKQQAAKALRQMAASEFFPKITANGTYMYNQNNIDLLTTDHRNSLENMGTNLQNQLTPQVQQIATQIANVNPQLAQQFLESFASLNIDGNLNQFGTDIANKFEFNIHHVYAGAVTIYEPIYMGGLIRNFYRSTKYLEKISEIQYDKDKEDVLVQVDEAYWRVISLQEKNKLAEEYCNLLISLEKDVETSFEEGVATQSDVLNVKVKLNEAQMQLSKAQNGLMLSKMLVYYLCGIDLNSNFDFETPEFNMQVTQNIDIQQVYDNRNEIKMLDYADKVALSGVRIARSKLLPNVAVQGSYIVTNPNVHHSFDNSFAGGFNAGVVVNIPICHVGDYFAVSAAKHKRAEIQYQMEDAKKKIELQVNKTNFEYQVSEEKVTQAESNLKHANENLRLAQESFKEGVIGSNDLMKAQVAWQSAHSDLIDAEIERNMCKLYLNNSLGIK